MKSIKEICPLPSMAIRKAIEGITKLSQDPLFKIDMSTFGRVEKDKKFICVGCLATATIMNIGEITPKQFIKSMNKMRDTFSEAVVDFELDRWEIEEFETAIDHLRYGDLEELLRFYELESGELDRLCTKWYAELDMGTDDWKKNLPKLELMAQDLEKLGY